MPLPTAASTEPVRVRAAHYGSPWSVELVQNVQPHAPLATAADHAVQDVVGSGDNSGLVRLLWVLRSPATQQDRWAANQDAQVRKATAGEAEARASQAKAEAEVEVEVEQAQARQTDIEGRRGWLIGPASVSELTEQAQRAGIEADELALVIPLFRQACTVEVLTPKQPDAPA